MRRKAARHPAFRSDIASHDRIIVVPTIDTVSDAIVVLGLSLTGEGELTRELKKRLDKAVECYRYQIKMPHAIIVCGSHSFIEQEKARFNEADKMEAYIHRKYGRHIVVLKERESDSIQNNLLMVRKQARKLSRLTVVSAAQVKRRVDQCVASFFPNVSRYRFVGCHEPGIQAAREKKLFDDFVCMTRWYAHMEPGDPEAYRKLLDDQGRSKWVDIRNWHHATCPSALGTGSHQKKPIYR